MICVIFTSELEIPEDGNDVLDDVLDAKQFWHKVYALSIGDFNLLFKNSLIIHKPINLSNGR